MKLYTKHDVTSSTNAVSDSKFWRVEYEETKSGKLKKNVSFDLLAVLSFLERNGFARIKSQELGDMNYVFVSIENSIARIVPDFEIRDFVWEHIVQNCKDKDVLNYAVEHLSTILGRSRLERLKRFDMTDIFEPNYQLRFFRNGQCHITADDIEFGPILSVVWDEAVQKRQFSRVSVIEDISPNASGSFDIRFSPAAEECEFLQYLRNTSWFWKSEKATPDLDVFYHHLVNKITAMGFLLSDYKFHSEDFAIVAMDAKMSEVGQSCGRSGKSLFGQAIGKVLSQAYIDGNMPKFNSVTARSRNIFIDQVNPNFKFMRLRLMGSVEN